MINPPTCIGIDVGGPRKGFHAVALSHDRRLEQFTSTEAGRVAAWCRDLGAVLIAIDAPCRWRGEGGVRAAERALVQSGFRCFWTPTRRAALSHPTGYFDWMLAGERLYRSLASTHPLAASAKRQRGPGCFETYPHAAACRLSGATLDVRRKRTDRVAVIEAAGFDAGTLRSQDAIDAAVCAMVAHAAATGCAEALGDATDGLIVLPRPLRGQGSPTLARL
ncbi:MAG: DUF429 domain-containing protein [Phycisphaerae bacterium]|jgi:predicted nuclease with RNAse H fold